MRILPPPLAACRRALLVAAAAVISSPSSRAGANVDSTAGLRLDGAALQRAQQVLYAPLPEVRSVSLSQCPVSPQQPTAAGCSGLKRSDLVAATGSGPERRALGACVPAGALRCSCAYLTRCGALVPTQSRSPCLGVPGSPWALLPGRGSSGGLRPCRCSGKARRCETRSASRRIRGAPFFTPHPPVHNQEPHRPQTCNGVLSVSQVRDAIRIKTMRGVWQLREYPKARVRVRITVIGLG